MTALMEYFYFMLSDIGQTKTYLLKEFPETPLGIPLQLCVHFNKAIMHYPIYWVINIL